MTETFTGLLATVSAGEDLSNEQMRGAIHQLISGDCSDEEMGLFLSALAAKGETVAEVAGAAAAMRGRMTPIRSSHTQLLDTCGTGGGGSRTFNISTSAALVIAAAGVPVAKHGNRSVTSRSGSADVLDQLGVNIGADIAQVERCLDQLGICFCFAPLMHPAMRHVAAVRKKLGIRTIFNLLGPLANPAGAKFQLLGVGRPELRPLIASALSMLQIERAFVVSGEDNLGEVTLSGTTHVSEVSPQGQRELQWTPEMFGIERRALDEISIDGPEQSAAMIRKVLAGERGAARDIVLLNAAAGLILANPSVEPEEAARKGAEAIDSGAAKDLLSRLVTVSHESSSH